MRISYDYNKEDRLAVLDYQIGVNKEYRTKKRNRTLFTAFVILFVGGVTVLQSGQHALWIAVATALAFLFIFSFYQDKDIYRRAYSEALDSSKVKREREVTEMEIFDDYLLVEDELAKVELKYRSIEKIEHTDDYSLIFLSPFAFYNVPTRKIREGDVKLFFNTLAKKCKEAQPGGPYNSGQALRA